MNILFIHSLDDILSPAKPLRTPEQMHFGISYISSVLKGHGHNTRLAVLSRMLGERNRRMMDEHIGRFLPKLICFTAVCTEYGLIREMARYAKVRYPGIYLIGGGPHISLNPEEAICDDFDAICIGEGEYPTLELISQLENGSRPSGIQNLWIKNAPGIEKNKTRPFIQDLDSLPFPDRDMWSGYIERMPGSAEPVLLGRGCPFSCTYCCNPGLRNLANGPYVRFRSPDNIINETKEIIKRNPSETDINLEVETIGVNKAWALELCAKLELLNSELQKPLSFITNLRITPNAGLETLFAAFKRCNINTIKIGLESGSERVRYEILKRNYSNRDIVYAVRSARRYDLKVTFYNLIGVPGETLADFGETIRMNRLCLPDRTIPHIFFPYPGTELYAVCKKEGVLPTRIETELERSRATLDLPGFTRRQIQDGFVWFEYDVYKGHKPMIKIFFKVLVSKFLSNPILHDLYRRITYLGLFRLIRKKAILT